jgi:ankyrin repeat protein
MQQATFCIAELMWTRVEGIIRRPLNAAASRIAHPGSEAVIHLLIQSKADINMVDDHGWGPLHQTCWFGNTQLVQLLLQSGADIDSQDCGGGSPLHLASFGGHLSVIQILLEHNAEIDAKARLKRVDLKVGSKYEARLSNRRTPLMEAAWNGQEEAVQVLLDLGANINAVDDHGMTTLIRAARCGYEKLVKILLSRGADAAVKDKKGWTAEKWLSAVCLNESGNGFGTGSYDDIRTDNEITIKSALDLGPSSADVRSYVEHRNLIINSC